MKVRLHCCTHDLNSEASEELEVNDNTSDEDLEKLAEDFFWNEKEPGWWFEKLEE